MLITILLGLAFTLTVPPQGTVYIIQGRVVDEQHRPVKDVRVILTDDSHFIIASVYADVSGRYKFPGRGRGVYYVQVETTGTDYEPQNRRVELYSLTEGRAGLENVFQDFVLAARRKAGPPVTGETVFAQDVPEKAQAEFKKAMDLAGSEKHDEAVESFKRALAIFPDYFQALEALGTVQVKRGQYEAAVPPLRHAVEVNPRAAVSYYSLGMALLNLKQLPEAVESLRKSAALNVSSPNTQLMLGYALISNRQFAEAEAPLKLAYQLGGAKAIDAQQYLAVIYDKLGRYKEAAAALEVYIKEAPKGVDKEKYKALVERLKKKAEAEKK